MAFEVVCLIKTRSLYCQAERYIMRRQKPALRAASGLPNPGGQGLTVDSGKIN
jgi:hypothetical protein